MDRQTDGQTDELIRVGLNNLRFLQVNMAGIPKLFPTMVKAWQIGGPPIASPMHPARELTLT